MKTKFSQPKGGSFILASKGAAHCKIYTLNQASGVLFSVDYRHGGRRFRQAFKDLAEAKTAADGILDKLIAGDIEALKMTGADRAIYQRAVETVKECGLSVDVVCERFANAYKVLGGDFILNAAQLYRAKVQNAAPPVAVADVVKEFLDAKRQGQRTYLKQRKPKAVSDRYMVDLEQKLTAFVETFHCPIQSVTTDLLNRFLANIDAAGRTRNNYLAAVASLFSFAKFKGYLAKDFDIMDRVDMVAEADFEIEIYTANELKKLLAASDELMTPIISIQAFAGLRTAEVLRLDWSEIKFESGVIEVSAKKSKTGARRLVPILPVLKSWLAPYKEKTGPLWPHCHQYVYECQDKVAAKAGLAWKHNALRHSFCTYRVADTQNLPATAYEAGHSVQMLNEHYRELSTKAQASAWFAVLPSTPANVVPMAAQSA
jgi:integrase